MLLFGEFHSVQRGNFKTHFLMRVSKVATCFNLQEAYVCRYFHRKVEYLISLMMSSVTKLKVCIFKIVSIDHFPFVLIRDNFFRLGYS